LFIASLRSFPVENTTKQVNSEIFHGFFKLDPALALS